MAEKVQTSNFENHRLTLKIVIALILGVSCGFLLKAAPDSALANDFLLNGVIYIVSKVFVSSLKMLVVPLVFVSLVCGVVNLENLSKLGSLGSKTLTLYLVTTAMAITLALGLATFVGPGTGFNLPSDLSFNPKNSPALQDILANIVPSNPVKSAAEGNMLQIIFFAILFGCGISMMGKNAQKVSTFFKELNDVIMKVLEILMWFAPYGVFALICRVFATQGFDAITPLISYFLVVLTALLLHFFISYPVILSVLARVNPILFLRKIRPTLMFAFSTASSNATIPLTLKMVTDKLGVSKSVASFTVPLGATINMDGTAIMQGAATVFIAQAYNIDIGLTGYLTVILTATLASIGTAGVPGVGLITLAMVLRQVGLPVEGIGMIMGVDRLLDMTRTAVNIAGDATVSCIVAKSENKLDLDIYKSEELLKNH